ncbi:hypothetical protein KUV50_02895 [Membranicola marinus]|uniref:Uncharacterized protein n=1 Tax=Membranihabitans marinus TaxID=1227546 RepID=A0A953HJX3_9BACT|nr:hypothetical protein [Membranihabitans marinus]MBY5957067.1 hypothetical protein [Membranihabitans marinus]
MTQITSKLNELRLQGMSRSWESLVETRHHQDHPERRTGDIASGREIGSGTTSF